MANSIRGQLPVTALLAATGLTITTLVPLPDFSPPAFVSGYGSADNRRLLMQYGSLLLAVVTAPALAAIFSSKQTFRTPPPTATQPTRANIYRPLDRALLGFMILLVLGLLIGPGIAFGPIDGHELVHLGYLSEMERGQTINVDTRVTYGPLHAYSLFYFMKATGFSLVQFRMFWNVSTAFVILISLALIRRGLPIRPLWVLLCLYLLAYTLARFYLPDNAGIQGGKWGHGNMLRQGWVPLSILFLHGLERVPLRFFATIAGFLATAGSLFAQESLLGGIVCLGMLAVLLHPESAARRTEALLAFLLGALATALLISFPAWSRGELVAYLDATTRSPRLFMAGAGNTKYPSFSLTTVHLYVLPVACLVMLTASLKSLRAGRLTLTSPLALYASISQVSLLVRPDQAHFFNVMLAPILVFFLLVHEFLNSQRRFHGRVARRTLYFFLALPLILLRPGLPELGSGLIARITNPMPTPPAGYTRIDFPRGGIWTPKENFFKFAAWKSSIDLDAIPMIHRLMEGGETVIFGAQSSLIYFLGSIPCAVPYTDLSSQRQTPEDIQVAVESHGRKGTQLLLCAT